MRADKHSGRSCQLRSAGVKLQANSMWRARWACCVDIGVLTLLCALHAVSAGLCHGQLPAEGAAAAA
jgi:hypothetical protein